MAASNSEVDNLKQRLELYIVSSITLGILLVSCFGLIAWLIHTDSLRIESRSFVVSEEDVHQAKVSLLDREGVYEFAKPKVE